MMNVWFFHQNKRPGGVLDFAYGIKNIFTLPGESMMDSLSHFDADLREMLTIIFGLGLGETLIVYQEEIIRYICFDGVDKSLQGNSVDGRP